jgi:hypothetical protein
LTGKQRHALLWVRLVIEMLPFTINISECICSHISKLASFDMGVAFSK